MGGVSRRGRDALRPRGLVDRLGTALVLVGISAPPFVVALLLRRWFATLAVSVAVIVLNLVVDVVYSLLDPRILVA